MADPFSSLLRETFHSRQDLASWTPSEESHWLTHGRRMNDYVWKAREDLERSEPSGNSQEIVGKASDPTLAGVTPHANNNSVKPLAHLVRVAITRDRSLLLDSQEKESKAVVISSSVPSERSACIGRLITCAATSSDTANEPPLKRAYAGCWCRGIG